MKNESKLKPKNWGLIIILFAVLFFVALILDNSLDRPNQLKVYGAIHLGFVLINLLILLKTKSLTPLCLILISMTMTLSYWTNYKGIWITIPIIFLFSLYFIILFMNIKYHSHYRHLLELAAKSVKGKADGFTSRPLAAGKSKFTRQELMDFAAFLKKNWIALPYYDDKRVMLAIKDQSRFWFGQPTETRDSYISFYYDGNVTVNIAKKDYQKYRDELTFDQLCLSMANLFKTYLDLFQNKKTDAILQHIREGS